MKQWKRLTPEALHLFVEVGDCWEWNMYLRKGGYGMASWNGKRTNAHRAVYEMLVGPIPDGLHVDHLCRNPRCVNPDHMDPVTQRENLQRSPITVNAIGLAKTRCIHGHPFDADNTYVHPRTDHRTCRACGRRRKHEERLRKRMACDAAPV